MSNTFQIIMIISVLLYFTCLIFLLKKRSLNIKYTLLWIFSGVLMLLLAVFPEILNRFATIVGVYDPTNALFALILFCIIIILMSLTAIVSKLNEKNKQLAQAIAKIEKRLRDINK